MKLSISAIPFAGKRINTNLHVFSKPTSQTNIYITIRILNDTLKFNNHDIELRDIGYALFGKSFSKIDNLYTYSGFHKKIKPYFNNSILGIHVCLLVYIFYHNRLKHNPYLLY